MQFFVKEILYRNDMVTMQILSSAIDLLVVSDETYELYM
jgi:hypothetical protein